MEEHKIKYEDGVFYQEKDIHDRGFAKWASTFDKTAEVIKWISLLISFKFYRMTYSLFMGRK